MLVWSDQAGQDLDDIADFIALDNPVAAVEWIEELVAAAERLPGSPRMGRRVPEFGREDLRELIQGNYRIVYRIAAQTIEVVTVFEGRKLLPSSTQRAQPPAAILTQRPSRPATGSEMLPTPPDRDCMAPDTEPTDEELALVMREVAVVVRERKAIGDKWLADQIAKAFAEVGLKVAPRSDPLEP